MIDENSSKEEVMSVVSQDVHELAYASKRLRNDVDVVNEAIKHDDKHAMQIQIL